MSLHPPPKFKYPSEIRNPQRGVRANGRIHIASFFKKFMPIVEILGGFVAKRPSPQRRPDSLGSADWKVRPTDQVVCRRMCPVAQSRAARDSRLRFPWRIKRTWIPALAPDTDPGLAGMTSKQPMRRYSG